MEVPKPELPLMSAGERQRLDRLASAFDEGRAAALQSWPTNHRPYYLVGESAQKAACMAGHASTLLLPEEAWAARTRLG